MAGDYNNGEYTNLLGLVQNKEVDFALTLVPFECRDEAFDLSPALTDFRSSIHSFTKAVIPDTRDIIESLTVVDLGCWALASFLVFLHFIALYCMGIHARLFDYIPMLFRQWYESQTLRLARFASFVITLLLFFLTTVVLGAFSTDISSDRLPPKIDSLEAIIAQNVTPYFFKPFKSHEPFISSPWRAQQKIWSMIEATGLDNAIFDMGDVIGVQRLLSSMLNYKGAFIAPSCLHPIGVTYFCAFQSGQYEEMLRIKKIYYSSKPFQSQVLAFPIRRNLSPEKVERLKQVSYTISERGFVTDMIGIGSELIRHHMPQFSITCETAMLEMKLESFKFKYNSISAYIMLKSWLYLLSFVFVATFVLLTELGFIKLYLSAVFDKLSAAKSQMVEQLYRCMTLWSITFERVTCRFRQMKICEDSLTM